MIAQVFALAATIVAVAAQTATITATPPETVVVGPPSANEHHVGAFRVQSLYAQAEPHGSSCFYGFDVSDVSDNPKSSFSTHCGKTMPCVYNLPGIYESDNATCEDPSVHWTFLPQDGGFNLTITHDKKPNRHNSNANRVLEDVGHAYFPRSDIEDYCSATQSWYYLQCLRAPQDFEVPYSCKRASAQYENH
ncbi:hypothetical protein LTR66_013053 [Elasticomyces elasticus]|nr:hypothetical protein LTR66_013053 [Elasticomyces elasticus]KAK4959696.1 hypothetical protein LTR28_005122 [Elasticomyces elasticus]